MPTGLHFSKDCAIERLTYWGYVKNYYPLRYAILEKLGRVDFALEDRLIYYSAKVKEIKEQIKVVNCMKIYKEKEIQEKEFIDLPRLAMNFNMRDYGRLCEMIHVINRDRT